jgi:hypothetical protein
MTGRRVATVSGIHDAASLSVIVKAWRPHQDLVRTLSDSGLTVLTNFGGSDE